jgi:hypothetical protein
MSKGYAIFFTDRLGASFSASWIIAIISSLLKRLTLPGLRWSPGVFVAAESVQRLMSVAKVGMVAVPVEVFLVESSKIT